MPWGKAMQEALEMDAEYLHQMTGEDHGPEFGDFVPCECCSGSGVEVYGCTTYEAGCAFGHPDSAERKCDECNGSGYVWEDTAEPAGIEHTRND